MRRIVLILLLAISQIGAASPAPVIAPPEKVLRIPLVALLADPERFDGKLVTVDGFLNLKYEGDAIYQSRSDFDEMLTGNALWVDGPKFDEPRARRDLSGRNVSVTGRFDAEMHGHFGMYAGGLGATAIRVRLNRDQIRATMSPTYREGPWPLLILILLPSSVLLALALAVRRRQAASAPGAGLTASALLVASAIGIFSILRLWELPRLFPGLIDGGIPWAGPTVLAELVVGGLALSASMFFAARRNTFLCVVFATAQLIVPAINEVRAFHIFDVPLSIYSARDQDYRWRRTGPLPPEGRTAGPDWFGFPR